MAQEGGGQGQTGRRHRRNRNRQGDDGVRSGRRGHACQDRGARRHAGRAGQDAHRRVGGRGRGRQSRRGRGRQGRSCETAAAKTGRHRAFRADGSSGCCARLAGGASRASSARPPRGAATAAGSLFSARTAPGNAGRPPQPRLLFSPGATNGERGGHRPRSHSGFRSARPHHCARCRSGQVGPRDHGSRSASRGAWRPSTGRREDPRAVRARFVRSCPARQHSQSDCAASPRSEAYDPPLLPDARLQDR